VFFFHNNYNYQIKTFNYDSIMDDLQHQHISKDIIRDIKNDYILMDNDHITKIKYFKYSYLKKMFKDIRFY